jgi:Ni,Fe-hydrogenase III component G
MSLAIPFDRGEVSTAVASHLADGYRAAMVAGAQDDDGFRVVYVLVRPADDHRVEVVLRVPASQTSIPSLAAVSYPVGRFEREMRDLYGFHPEGHPLPHRLVRHGGMVRTRATATRLVQRPALDLLSRVGSP